MDYQSAICLIHGHGVDATIWSHIDADLSAVGQVFAPDVAHVATHRTIDEYADLLVKYLRAEVGESGRAVLVGHSMGGYIALAFAEKYPAMVRGLVLFHSTAYADDEAKKEQRRQTVESLKTEGSAPFIEKTIPKMMAPGFPADQTQALIEQYRTLPADALAAGMEAMMNRPDRTHVLRDATYPVLVVLGREDQLIPYEKTSQLVNLSEQISVVTIKQAGHLSMIEQPAEAATALRTWLADLK